MAGLCRDDPLVCIEFVVVGIGEFLKDWTTMAMFALLLALLLKLRADRQRAKEQAYAAQLVVYEETLRIERERGMTWVMDGQRPPDA